ncbi:BMP family ABC transporter substrate-binding protein [Vibrio panuliri]|uniref:BMP family ABC transporter substrate-binding protein n=1 Tax=Vibrio panuliri TaxID=1381081 RepID=UPI0009F8AEBA|nr:BMP family ABC transporter substrate-binding protein [Vibrio panuliri]KAB1458306.1 BMP family ABC transporter substrate-binding protein [Vibrio panuliri]
MNTRLLQCCSPFVRSLYSIITLIFGVVCTSSTLAQEQSFKPVVIYQSELQHDSYLALIDAGIRQFEEKTQVSVMRQHVGDKGYVHSLRQAAEQGYTPIVVVESNSQQDFAQVATSFPSVHFISLDVAYHLPNVLGLTFNHAEGSYVLGYLSGLKTKTNRIGFIGGLDIPIINHFKCGYELGIRDANPEASLMTQYINKGLASWDDLNSAQAIANTMLAQQVDIIFPAAGYASVGAMEAVKVNGHALSFGVDHNYSNLYPLTNLASLEKRVDIAVFASLMQLKNAIWNGNRKHFGIKQGVINVAINPHTPNLTDKEKQLMAKLMRDFKGNNTAISQKVARYCPTQI